MSAPAAETIKISSVGPHHGEEPFLSGTKGSGTIFFTGCNLRCVYCQNYQISQEGLGYEISLEQLADKMLGLQEQGCHNINFVSPTHVAHKIKKALVIAKEQGLKIPIVYNTNGSDAVSTLRSLEGLIDIYLPDIKYSDNELAFKYSGVKGYVEKNCAAIAEMFRQVGNLILDEEDIAKRGLIARRLVLPNNIAGSRESLAFLASLSKDIWLSVMAQYHPCYKSEEYPELNRRISAMEYDQVLEWIHELGFKNVLSQELDSSSIFLPDFMKNEPFTN